MTYEPPLPQNSDDMIDSRDVIYWIDSLEADLADGNLDEDDQGTLDDLIALAEEGETLDDWEYGVQLIRDAYFETFAQEFAEGIGAIDASQSGGNWPLYCIDWEMAARELQMDYTPVDFGTVTYWAR